MNPRYKRINTATALFLVFAVTQVYVATSVAAPKSPSYSPPGPQQITGLLTTNSNQPISVNGTSAVSGATILPGATIETPDRVAASTSIPGHALLEIYQKSKLTLMFDQGSVKVTLIYGCVVLHTMKGTSGLIIKENGNVIGTSDQSKDGVIKVCEPSGAGALPPHGANTAAIALVAIGGAAALIIALALRGNNPSPSRP